jgi:hypothetical protein
MMAERPRSGVDSVGCDIWKEARNESLAASSMRWTSKGQREVCSFFRGFQLVQYVAVQFTPALRPRAGRIPDFNLGVKGFGTKHKRTFLGRIRHPEQM